MTNAENPMVTKLRALGDDTLYDLGPVPGNFVRVLFAALGALRQLNARSPIDGLNGNVDKMCYLLAKNISENMEEVIDGEFVFGFTQEEVDAVRVAVNWLNIGINRGLIENDMDIKEETLKSIYDVLGEVD